jgi:hypothetical protein
MSKYPYIIKGATGTACKTSKSASDPIMRLLTVIPYLHCKEVEFWQSQVIGNTFFLLRDSFFFFLWGEWVEVHTFLKKCRE